MVEDVIVVVNRALTGWQHDPSGGNGLAELESMLVRAFAKRDESVATELRQLRTENARLRAVAEAAKIVARMYSTFEVVRNELDPALKELEAPHEG